MHREVPARFGRESVLPAYLIHEIPELINEIKEASRDDFVKVCRGEYAAEELEAPEIYFECNRKKCALCDPQCRKTTDVRFAKNFAETMQRGRKVYTELTKDDTKNFREQRTYRNMFRLMEVLDYADIVRIIMTSKEVDKAIRTVDLEDEIRILAGNDFVIGLRPLAERLAEIDDRKMDYNDWLDHVWRRLRDGDGPEDVVKDLQYILDRAIEKVMEVWKMAEYIDRERLLERLRYYFEHTGGDAHYAYGVAINEIRNAPAERVTPSDTDVIENVKIVGVSAINVAEGLKNVINALENVDRCVCCGEIVPEGRQVCPACEAGGDV